MHPACQILKTWIIAKISQDGYCSEKHTAQPVERTVSSKDDNNNYEILIIILILWEQSPLYNYNDNNRVTKSLESLSENFFSQLMND